MDKLRRRRLKHFVPSSKALVASWIALGLMVMSGACSIFYAVTAETGAFLENAGFVFSFLGLPLVALAVGVGALMEKQAIPKALLAGLSVGMLAMAALIGSGTYAAYADVPGTEWAMMFCYAPLVFVFSIPFIYALTKVPRAWRSLIQEEREEKALAIIHSHSGEATYEELEEALGISEEEVDALLLDIVTSRKALGSREVRFKRFYMVAAVLERQARLLGIVEARGQVPLEDLAAELRAPECLVKEWSTHWWSKASSRATSTGPRGCSIRPRRRSCERPDGARAAARRWAWGARESSTASTVGWRSSCSWQQGIGNPWLKLRNALMRLRAKPLRGLHNSRRRMSVQRRLMRRLYEPVIILT